MLPRAAPISNRSTKQRDRLPRDVGLGHPPDWPHQKHRPKALVTRPLAGEPTRQTALSYRKPEGGRRLQPGNPPSGTARPRLGNPLGRVS
jgi:hypothetical protein